jgi:hypothetical protein
MPKLDHVAALAWIDDVLARVRASGGAWTGAQREDLRRDLMTALAADGAIEINVDRLARLDRQHARERAAEVPRFEHVGELRSERVARLAAERAHAAAVEAEIEANPPLGSEANPVDYTTPDAVERHARAERAGRTRPVRAAVAERVERLRTARPSFEITDYTNPRRAA